MKIFENSSNKCHLRRFIWAVLSRIFYFSIEIDALVAERRCKFYSIPSFRRYRIQPNLYSVGDSRGKPEGPNIIPGTRGSRYAWDPTCIHFPNRRVNVKNTARVFSRRVRVEKKKRKKDTERNVAMMKMSEEFVALKKFWKKYLPMTFFIFGNGYLMIIKRTYDYSKDKRQERTIFRYF